MTRISETLHQWAASREASDEVAEAIHHLMLANAPDTADVAPDDNEGMDRIWQDPTSEEVLAVWERVTSNGAQDASEYQWGEGTLAEVLGQTAPSYPVDGEAGGGHLEDNADAPTVSEQLHAAGYGHRECPAYGKREVFDLRTGRVLGVWSVFEAIEFLEGRRG